MEAQFFKKFYTEAHKIVMDYNLMSSSIELNKDPIFFFETFKNEISHLPLIPTFKILDFS